MAKRPIATAQKADNKAAEDARLWKKELQLATKREKTWRDEGEKIVARYRGEQRKKNRYNVLWSNTETLRPAIYNTDPVPDVRRRFRDADPLGKAGSEVLERSLVVLVDGYSFGCAMRNDLLDTLLPGRGLSRIRYLPVITQTAPPETEDDEAQSISSPPELEEKLDYEQVCIEHVDWRDFRHGYGRTWEEVMWEGFRHKLTRADAEKKFNKEDLKSIKFAMPTSDDANKPGEETNETQKVAEFWEIWDKLGRKVFFTQEDCDHLLFPKDNPDGEPPLDFEDFYPNPEPLKIIENTGSTLPIAHFSLYEEQANELDKLSMRIDKIVSQLKLRGVYDSKLKELADLMNVDDNDMVPVQNTGAWTEAGLDKAISWMPTEKAVAVLESLYEAREKQKAIIDEIIGLSDIVRGVTDANETYGAQELKSQYHAVRLQRMQKEMQRYARDMLRLAASVIASKFGQDTLAKMTDLKFPTIQQKQLLQAQAQQGQPIDPSILQIPAWEEIIGLLRSPSMRQFRIDIETDSTIAGTLESDLTGLKEVLGGVAELLTEMGPVVQSGALPVDAAKELVMAVIRRARLGTAVEDAFDKMQAPNPTPPPPDHSIEVAQIKAASDERIAQIKSQAEMQQTQFQHEMIARTEQMKSSFEQERHKNETVFQIQQQAITKDHEAALEQLKMQNESARQADQLETQRMIADANNQTKLMIAEVGAKMAAQQQNHDAQMQSMQQAHEKATQAIDGDQKTEQLEAGGRIDAKAAKQAPAAADYKAQEDFTASIKELVAHLKQPKRIIRDENGKIVGVH